VATQFHSNTGLVKCHGNYCDGWLIWARVSGLWGREKDDDVATFGWLNFECLDATMCHALIGRFN